MQRVLELKDGQAERMNEMNALREDTVRRAAAACGCVGEGVRGLRGGDAGQREGLQREGRPLQCWICWEGVQQRMGRQRRPGLAPPPAAPKSALPRIRPNVPLPTPRTATLARTLACTQLAEARRQAADIVARAVASARAGLPRSALGASPRSLDASMRGLDLAAAEAGGPQPLPSTLLRA